MPVLGHLRDKLNDKFYQNRTNNDISIWSVLTQFLSNKFLDTIGINSETSKKSFFIKIKKKP